MDAARPNIGEVTGDELAHFHRLLVVRLVVARAQHVGPEQDASRDFGAESGRTCGLVHAAQAVALEAQAVPHAVEAGEVRGALGGGDDVIGGNREHRVGQRDVANLCPAFAQGVERAVACLAHRRGERFGEILHGTADDDPAEIPTRRAQRRHQLGCGGGVGHPVIAGDHLHRERRIIDGSAEHTDVVERRGEGDQSEPADPPVGWLHADDAAKRGRLPHRAAGFRSECDRHDAGGDGGRRAAARPARHTRAVEWIPRRSERAVLGGRPHRELVHVALADEHRPRFAEPPGDGRLIRTDVALENARTAGRGEGCRGDVVLEHHGHSGEGAEARHGAGRQHSCRGIGGQDAIQAGRARVDVGGAGEAGLGDGDRGRPALPHRRGDRRRTRSKDLGAHVSSPPSSCVARRGTR